MLERGKEECREASAERRYLKALAVALAGAGPSLVNSMAGGAFISDDWGFLTLSSDQWMEQVDRNARPFQWLLHMVSFSVLGGNAWAHALLLAVFGALFAVLFWLALEPILGGRMALFSAILWGVIPSGSTVRYWNSAAPILLAMIFLVAALLWATRHRGQFWPTTILIAASILTYESGAVLGAAIMAYSLWNSEKRKIQAWVIHGGVLFAAVAWNLLNSPKEPSGVKPLAGIGDVPVALFGGLLPGLPWQLVNVGSLLIPTLTLMVWFRSKYKRFGPAVAGLAAAMIGVSVQVLVGFRPILAIGLLDRAVAMAIPGLAILCAGLVVEAESVTKRNVASGLVAILVTVFGIDSFGTGQSVRQAETDLVSALVEVEMLPTGTLVELPDRQAYAAAVNRGELETAAEVLGIEVQDTIVIYAIQAGAKPDFTINNTVTVAPDGSVEVTPGTRSDEP